MMTNLLKLAERIEAGEANNAEIAIVLRQFPKTSPWIDKNFPQWGVRGSNSVHVVHSDGKTGAYWTTEHYLTSLDAAQAMHENVVPEWKVSHAFWDEERAEFNLTRKERVGDEPTNRYAGGKAKKPAQAYMAAILRAKHAEGES